MQTFQIRLCIYIVNLHLAVQVVRLAAEKRIHHAPAVVTPLAVSAGGGMFPEDDDRLPCGADRNGRHWLRVELSSTLLKFRTALTWQ